MSASWSGSGFWRGRRVLVTGHTGFKGGWLVLALQHLGAKVSGISLAAEAGPTLFAALSPWAGLDHHEIDITHAEPLAAAVRRIRPEVVFHLAAQALVGRAHARPAETFSTNVAGTVNLLQALRGLGGVAAALIVTSDKVYRNDGSGRAFVEGDALGGGDPYSASKAAAELAVASWRESFGDQLPALATARAGNVIGGGDFGAARLLPDLIRAQQSGVPLGLRYPEATRPWQHVLDLLPGYLALAQALAESPATTPHAMNFGPPAGEGVSVRELIAHYEQANGVPVPWQAMPGPHAPEAPRLAIDASLAERVLGWRTRKPLALALAETAAWYRAWPRGDNLRRISVAAVEEALHDSPHAGLHDVRRAAPAPCVSNTPEAAVP